MRITKKQYEFMEYLEEVGGLPLVEVNSSKFPMSLVDALKLKGLVYFEDGFVYSCVS